ncbi:hypothetical protein T439DRAFT_321056 [Meredithblackwellia eburnea MCA 4105]
MASDLLHDALTRHAQQSSITSNSITTTPNIAQLSLSDDDDEALIQVRTPLNPSTPATTSRASTPGTSRSSSPTRSQQNAANAAKNLTAKPRSGAGKPRRDKTKEREKALANQNSMDPLSKFPGEISGRIFGELDHRDLLRCGLVSKRWRRSATINYTWYLLLQSHTYVDPISKPYKDSSALPTWRRGDSKVDWAARFASIFKRDETVIVESETDENGLTQKEEHEAKWAEENEANAGGDKNAMRSYYKSLGNSKVKGKTGKGLTRTWDEDGLGGGGDDYV